MLNIDTIRNHYKTLSERYEQEPLAVSWGNDNERNQLRYQTVVSKILFKEEPVSILDVGSGHGEILKYFPSDNFSYTGIDFVDNSIYKGQAAHDYKHEFIHGDFETYEFNKSF
ncbi:MAG: class I SAM-dependent methyltransferase, partial [Rickettsiales bacterium]|nr:class I SAM-dependent methyltransferase [Rickettsiales bacterium]